MLPSVPQGPAPWPSPTSLCFLSKPNEGIESNDHQTSLSALKILTFSGFLSSVPLELITSKLLSTFHIKGITQACTFWHKIYPRLF